MAKIGVGLGGGAVLGASLIGILRALEEAGIDSTRIGPLQPYQYQQNT